MLMCGVSIIVVVLTFSSPTNSSDFATCLQYDVGLAINCLANIATPDLSRDLISDLVQLLGNHKPYVRKKALLAM